jgi:hypothetical protein
MTTKIRIPIKEVIFFLKEIGEEKKKEIEVTKKDMYIDSILVNTSTYISDAAMNFFSKMREIDRYISELKNRKEKYHPLIDEMLEEKVYVNNFLQDKSEEINKMRKMWVRKIPTIEELNIIQNILKDIILVFKKRLEKVSKLLNILQKEADNKYTEKIFNVFRKKANTFDYDFIIHILQELETQIPKDIEHFLKDIHKIYDFIEYLQLEKD